MELKQELLGRAGEKERLKTALESSKPELVAVIGRRRVGKTFLVRKVYGDKIKLEVTGLQKGKKKEQLRNFQISMRAFGLQTPLDDPPDNWLDTFFLLTQELEKKDLREKYVIFLDELPWMAGKRSDFITGFSYFWNSWASKQNIVVVICGSAASWMIEKVVNDKGGLHNRITDIIHLQPFNLKETEAFLIAKNINYPRYQVILLYMAIGGIPMYLDFVRKNLSAVQNIDHLCFRESGFLYDEFDRLFPALFDRHERHSSIVKTLASKQKGMTRQEIMDGTGLPNGGSLSKTLKELQQSGFIKNYPGIGKKKKEVLYRLVDAYCLFYLRQVAPNKGSQTVSFEQLYAMPPFKNWCGYAYENVCLDHLVQIKTKLGISGILTRAYSFVAKPKDGLPGTQIDLLIDRADQAIHICEIKFSTGEYIIDKKTAKNIRQKHTVFRYHTKTRKHLFTTFITTFGLVDNNWRKETVDQSVTMDDLFV
ncbi:MAG TPA: ATP-binding protein [Bacteroidetes bacterium]|nr:ATP-binding protein [Bacteroidota bacterium]